MDSLPFHSKAEQIVSVPCWTFRLQMLRNLMESILFPISSQTPGFHASGTIANLILNAIPNDIPRIYQGRALAFPGAELAKEFIKTFYWKVLYNILCKTFYLRPELWIPLATIQKSTLLNSIKPCMR